MYCWHFLFSWTCKRNEEIEVWMVVEVVAVWEEIYILCDEVIFYSSGLTSSRVVFSLSQTQMKIDRVSTDWKHTIDSENGYCNEFDIYTGITGDNQNSALGPPLE